MAIRLTFASEKGFFKRLIGGAKSGMTADSQLCCEAVASIAESARSMEPVDGLTHGFYRYPARFSPLFARSVIQAFSQPGDLVMDPFMGGGTTLVEARALGRRVLGTDISSLAAFVTRVKVTPLTNADLAAIRDWLLQLPPRLNLRNPPVRATEWIEAGYQRNISGKRTWPIRKTLELALSETDKLRRLRQRRFVRCALLRTAQWALDCRKAVPSALQFREKFYYYVARMLEDSREFTRQIKTNDTHLSRVSPLAVCLNKSVIGIESDDIWHSIPRPQLILTSPPYPGVHVVYHRWQISGRKETPAPFWIAHSLDGAGESYYTFGSRKNPGLKQYFDQLRLAFSSLAKLAHESTVVVQMLSFAEASWQLSEYLDVMRQCGFAEMTFSSLSDSPDGRIWRDVPNRKWYADHKGALGSSKEVVLFHRLSR